MPAPMMMASKSGAGMGMGSSGCWGEVTRTVTPPAKPRPCAGANRMGTGAWHAPCSPPGTSGRGARHRRRPRPLTVVVAKGGDLDLCGFDVSASPPVIEETARLVGECRAGHIPIIHLRNGFPAELREAGGPAAPPWLYRCSA